MRDKKNIFVLEDNKEFLNKLLPKLKERFTVFEADDLRAGINVLKRNLDKIDLILLDITMTVDGILDPSEAKDGRTSGMVFLEHIVLDLYKEKAIPPTIFLTDYDDAKDLEKAKNMKSVLGIIRKVHLKDHCKNIIEEIEKLY